MGSDQEEVGRRPPAADTASLAPHLAGGCVLWEGASPAASRGTAEPGSAPPPPPPPAVTPEEAEEVSESRLGAPGPSGPAGHLGKGRGLLPGAEEGQAWGCRV